MENHIWNENIIQEQINKQENSEQKRQTREKNGIGEYEGEPQLLLGGGQENKLQQPLSALTTSRQREAVCDRKT